MQAHNHLASQIKPARQCTCTLPILTSNGCNSIVITTSKQYYFKMFAFREEVKLQWSKIRLILISSPLMWRKTMPCVQTGWRWSTTAVPAGLSPKLACALPFHFGNQRPIHPMAVSFNQERIIIRLSYCLLAHTLMDLHKHSGRHPHTTDHLCKD